MNDEVVTTIFIIIQDVKKAKRLKGSHTTTWGIAPIKT
jgi:hypothetical protein